MRCSPAVPSWFESVRTTNSSRRPRVLICVLRLHHHRWNFGLNKNLEQATDESNMRSPVIPLSLDSGLSNYWKFGLMGACGLWPSFQYHSPTFCLTGLRSLIVPKMLDFRLNNSFEQATTKSKMHSPVVLPSVDSGLSKFWKLRMVFLYDRVGLWFEQLFDDLALPASFFWGGGGKEVFQSDPPGWTGLPTDERKIEEVVVHQKRWCPKRRRKRKKERGAEQRWEGAW